MHTTVVYQLLRPQKPEVQRPIDVKIESPSAEVKVESPTAGGTKIPESDFWTRINGKICFIGALVDNVYFYADSIDLAWGLAPEILIFSSWGLGIGLGAGAILAALEAYSHKTTNRINQSAKITAPDDFPIPLKYKIPLGAHFVSDMTDWSGRLAMLGRLMTPNTIYWNIGLKVAGAVIGGASSVADTRIVYKAFQKLAYWESQQEQAPQTNTCSVYRCFQKLAFWKSKEAQPPSPTAQTEFSELKR